MMMVFGIYAFYDRDLATPVSWRGNLTWAVVAAMAAVCFCCYICTPLLFHHGWFGNVSMLARQPYPGLGCSHDWHLSEPSCDDHPVLVQMSAYVCICDEYCKNVLVFTDGIHEMLLFSLLLSLLWFAWSYSIVLVSNDNHLSSFWLSASAIY